MESLLSSGRIISRLPGGAAGTVADWYHGNPDEARARNRLGPGRLPAARRCSFCWPHCPAPPLPASAAPSVRLEIKGAIGPGYQRLHQQGHRACRQERNAKLVILIEMDTPGGLDSAMRDIIKAILASTVPVATWVSPERLAGRQCRHLHSVREPRRGDGAGDQSGLGATPVSIGGGSPPMPGPQPKPPAADGERRGRAKTVKRPLRQTHRSRARCTAMEKQVRQRCGRLHSRPGRTARPQCGLGRASRA